MQAKLLGVKGNWQEVKYSARTTVGLTSVKGEPASSWKRRMLLAEHSPIRKITVSWKWSNLLWWVQTHFTRHKFGVEWWVQTSRDDRASVDRSETGSQCNLVDVEGGSHNASCH